MNNCFLINEAIDVHDLELFKVGMSELISIEKDDIDKFWRYETIYQLNILQQLYVNFGQTEQNILQFINQLSPTEEYVNSEITSNRVFPADSNAFLGINFSGLVVPITVDLQITDDISFKNWKYKLLLHHCGFILMKNQIRYI